ncbi:MAG: hypothetical protein ACI9O0_001365 [Paracoccaceae bacterium]|jgi:hypothetical protein
MSADIIKYKIRALFHLKNFKYCVADAVLIGLLVRNHDIQNHAEGYEFGSSFLRKLMQSSFLS